MAKTFLLEIGLEDLPAKYILDTQIQLKEKIEMFLTDLRIPFEEVISFSTPRRLAVLVVGLANEQQSLEEEARGPALKIAKDSQGNWTKAAIGFAKGQGTEVDSLYIKEVKNIEYVFVLKKELGKPIGEVLPKIADVIKGLSFPKSMRWGSLDYRYIRPIKWMVALLDDMVIPFEVATVKTGRTTKGHRFLGDQVELIQAQDYEKMLKEQHVIPSYEERKALIVKQLKELETENSWTIPLDSDLLEEVTNLVEYPTALFGSFQEGFLRVPTEVLVTTMKEHQRYFPVFNLDKQLLPYFITIRNGNADYIETVRKGNEKVLTARLADAAFFYDEDLKKSIESCTDKLANIVFHEELGTIANKVSRIQKSSLFLSSLLKKTDEDESISRGAEISKFDLVTNMVYEFPELQGKMGEEYALKKGEEPIVARAINEHYMPRNAEDSIPNSFVGSVLSIADKLDTIVGFFSIGNIPTGSADPYALRRQAAGITQIIIKQDWNLNIESFIKFIFEQYEAQGFTKVSYDGLLKDLTAFFKVRMKSVLQETGIRFDVVDSILEGDTLNIAQSIHKAKVLHDIVSNGENKQFLEGLNRTINISKNHLGGLVDQSLLLEVELELYNKIQEVQNSYLDLLNQNKNLEAFELLKGFDKPIERYFDNIMVMCEDEQVRENRLRMLGKIRDMILQFANTTLLITK